MVSIFNKKFKLHFHARGRFSSQLPNTRAPQSTPSAGQPENYSNYSLFSNRTAWHGGQNELFGQLPSGSSGGQSPLERLLQQQQQQQQQQRKRHFN